MTISYGAADVEGGFKLLVLCRSQSQSCFLVLVQYLVVCILYIIYSMVYGAVFAEIEMTSFCTCEFSSKSTCFHSRIPEFELSISNQTHKVMVTVHSLRKFYYVGQSQQPIRNCILHHIELGSYNDLVRRLLTLKFILVNSKSLNH